MLHTNDPEVYCTCRNCIRQVKEKQDRYNNGSEKFIKCSERLPEKFSTVILKTQEGIEVEGFLGKLYWHIPEKKGMYALDQIIEWAELPEEDTFLYTESLEDLRLKWSAATVKNVSSNNVRRKITKELKLDTVYHDDTCECGDCEGLRKLLGFIEWIR